MVILELEYSYDSNALFISHYINQKIRNCVYKYKYKETENFETKNINVILKKEAD
jgi:hypothetical protein